ncbi:hypothetical protein [uncultured Tateyamaria sp.]|uniref:hypothetical protein n=1 Tax=uncultured Tateyamaria sp. TaxID=455651 RepID=UPI00262ACA01|nr:hypothetical protein [uncultured Tateyamaria sp.]
MALNALLPLAVQFGLPMLENVLNNKFGGQGGALATTVVREVARKSGVEVDQLEQYAADHPDVVEVAMRDVEAMAPEMIQLYTAGLEGQFALLQAEQRGVLWKSAWRPGWMYLLGVLWVWNIIGLHMINAIWKWQLPPVDYSILLQLTGLFMALLMGGHTLKDIGKSFVGAKPRP